MRSLLAALVLVPAVLVAANVGDVVAIHSEGLVTPVPSIPTLLQFDAAGRLLTSERRWAVAVATDARMNLYIADGQNVEVRDRYGTFLRSFPIGFGPSTMFVDRAGNLYAAVTDGPGLFQFAPDGTLLRSWPFRIGRRMDLAADQCTLVYVTLFGVVTRRNLCTGAEPVSLDVNTNGLRVTRDGRVVTNIGTQIRVYSLDGRLLHLVDYGGFALRLALAADGESVWMMPPHGEILRVRLRDGAILARTSAGQFSLELAVYGEPRGANAPDHVPEVPTLSLVAALILAAALAILAARQVA